MTVVPFPREIRHLITYEDVHRAWAAEYVAPDGAEVVYMRDRARFFLPDGTTHDVVGGQVPVDWYAVLQGQG